jgi:hypothetical protein
MEEALVKAFKANAHLESDSVADKEVEGASAVIDDAAKDVDWDATV